MIGRKKTNTTVQDKGWRNGLLSVTSLSGGLSLLIAASTAAMAADAPASQATQAPAVEEIVVTGTRVVRDGYEAPTPVTVMNIEEINRDAPVNLSDFMSKVPAFSTSIRPRNSSAAVGDGNLGVSNLNLRSLGANRTLVLLDGMRVVGSSINGFYHNGQSVDTNGFPDALVSRVDVVTGGASAAYGSDALAGVVNFVLDKKYAGVKGSVQGGVTTYGDDREWSVALTAGTGFAGNRGHFLISGSANYVDGILNNPRWWAQLGYGLIDNPAYTATNGAPSLIHSYNTGTSQATYGGLVVSGPLKGIDFGPGGVPRQYNYGITNGSTQIGGDWNKRLPDDPSPSLDNRVSRQNVFTRLSYEIGDDTEVFAHYNYSTTTALGFCCSPTNRSFIIQRDNPFLPAAVATQMTALGLTNLTMSTNHNDLGISGADNIRELSIFALGATGKVDAFDSGWSWNANAQRSISRTTLISTNNRITSRFALAIDAVRNPATGAIVCRSTLINPANGCVPYNTMGINVNSQAAIGYVTGQGHLNQNLVEDVLTTSASGEPFSSWAGPVSLAFGAEHRKESVVGKATALDEINGFQYGNYHGTTGSYQVNEGFVETVVPMAKDVPWAVALDLNGAARITDYSTSGTVVTWKVGATYSPVVDLRFRATRSRDIRAPNLGELFAAGQSGSTTVRDPFNNNSLVTLNQIVVGNAGLVPEEADTTGLGAVYQSSAIPGFSASFDYYKIDMTKAIEVSNPQQTLDRCFQGVAALCANIQRDAANLPTNVYLRPANVVFVKTDGFDVEASYKQKLADIVDAWDGDVTLRVLATHVFSLISQRPDGGIVDGTGVLGGNQYPALITPSWRWNTSLGYDGEVIAATFSFRGFNAGVQDNGFIQCTSGCPVTTLPVRTIDDNKMPGAKYMDLALTYKVRREGYSADVFLNVDNLANAEFLIPTLGSIIPGYDRTGRTFRAGVRFKM